MEFILKSIKLCLRYVDENKMIQQILICYRGFEAHTWKKLRKRTLGSTLRYKGKKFGKEERSQHWQAIKMKVFSQTVIYNF